MPTTILGKVVWNGCLRSSGPLPKPMPPPNDDIPIPRQLTFGIEYQIGHGTAMVQCHGLRAICLAGVQPGDRVSIKGATLVAADAEGILPPDAQALASQTGTSEAAAAVWTLGPGSSVNLSRKGRTKVFDDASVKAMDIPNWMLLPSPTPVSRVYQYANFLTSLESDIYVNVWCIFWENAKPGPFLTLGAQKIGINTIVVDPSFGHFPAKEWSFQPHLPEFSLQVAIPGNSLCPSSLGALPFFCVGDVVRTHRVKVHQKQERWMNLLSQKFTSIVRFRFGDDDEQGTGPLFPHAVTLDERPTYTKDHEAKARSLLAWSRGVLSKQRLSQYVVTISDFLQNSSFGYGSWDLIVQVVNIDKSREELIVQDGSVEEPFCVQIMPEPVHTVCWLFLHVEKGYWLKLRGVELYGSNAARCHAARVTRVPTYCLDVKERIAALKKKQQDHQEAPELAVREGQAEVEGGPELDDKLNLNLNLNRAEEATVEGAGQERRYQQPLDRQPPQAQGQHHQQEEQQQRQQQQQQQQHRQEQHTAPPRIQSFPELLPGRHSGKEASICPTERETHDDVNEGHEPSCSSAASSAACLATIYNVTDAELMRIPDALAATTQPGGNVGNGGGFILGDFHIEGVLGPFRDDVTSTRDLVCYRCSVCEHIYPWTTFGPDAMSAKRQRRSLPCGHWVWRLEFRCCLQLRDTQDESATLQALLIDVSRDVFGCTPTSVVADESAAEAADKRLKGLLRTKQAKSTSPNHTLAVYFRRNPSGDGGCYCVCDSIIKI